jgi:pimeloyl-ACP methyl ester carboxylesterase
VAVHDRRRAESGGGIVRRASGPGHQLAAAGSQQLTLSRVPVLSFNGDADPTDQPRNMAGMQQFWPDSREIALPGQGHYVTSASWPCESALTQVFIEQASVAHLDASCLAAIPAPAFDLTLQALAGGG